MFYKDAERIRTEINEAGALGKPFLFGIDYEMSEGFFIENPLFQDVVKFQIHGVGNKSGVFDDSIQAQLSVSPISYNEYQPKYDTVLRGLRKGDSFLANLTIKTPLTTNLTLGEIFARSNAPYQLYIPHKLVCFSPERFVKIEGGIISSNPMKGTIDAGIENAEQIIMNDFKETAEHNTIVDLIRNDLSMVAEKVTVKRFRYVDKIETNKKTILQVSSEVEGHLSADYQSHLGDILFRLLPAGSICGAPKKATVSMIREAEGEDRNYYTGVFGYFDGKKLDTGVLIRFIEKQGDNLFFRSGGGITAYSNCEDEYAEVLNKIYLPFL